MGQFLAQAAAGPQLIVGRIAIMCSTEYASRSVTCYRPDDVAIHFFNPPTIQGGAHKL